VNRRYWFSALAAFARAARRRGFLADVLRSGLTLEQEGRAQVVPMLDAYPEIEGLTVDLGSISFRRQNMDPLERFFLAALAALRQPKLIFEIGTFDGATTLLLARHAPDARVFTLDLATDQSHIGTPEGARITQLFGDSRNFDFQQWHGTADLVVVDAGHEYDRARADTRTAQRLVNSGGVIVWDDYVPRWPGVVRAVDETGASTVRIARTGLAVMDGRIDTPRLGPVLTSSD
jgi:predicted O-methyltransferase YrrM